MRCTGCLLYSRCDQRQLDAMIACQCPLARLVTLEVDRSLWRDPNSSVIRRDSEWPTEREQKHYHEGLKRGATRDTLVRLSCALERLLLIIYCSLISSRTRVNSYTLFHSNSLCFTNKDAIPQITVCFSIFTQFFRIKVRNMYVVSGLIFRF